MSVLYCKCGAEGRETILRSLLHQSELLPQQVVGVQTGGERGGDPAVRVHPAAGGCNKTSSTLLIVSDNTNSRF